MRTPLSLQETDDNVDTAGEAVDVVLETLRDLLDTLLENLPLIVIGLLVFVLGVVVAGRLAALSHRGFSRREADQVVARMTSRLLRLGVIAAFALLALAISGVPVGAALASLGIAGLAVALALQNMLENFVAGVFLLVRKPFRAGDQIRTGDFEGTVEEIDLRVTRLVDYDGETVLVPNADVFRNPLINLTRRGKRRTRVMVGVDYRNDHTRAGAIIRDAVQQVDGVLESPPAEALLTELGSSGINFEVRYWTLPDIHSVRHTQDRVLQAAKTAVESHGMTIPWPIRTLSFDNPLRFADGDGRPAPVGDAES